MTNFDRAIHGAAWALILSGIVAILGLAVHPMSASAAVSWKAQTCAAFRTWEHHPAPGSLAALVTDSVHLGRSYLKADAGQLYADASSPSAKAAKYLGDDATYVNQDCGG